MSWSLFLAGHQHPPSVRQASLLLKGLITHNVTPLLLANFTMEKVNICQRLSLVEELNGCQSTKEERKEQKRDLLEVLEQLTLLAKKTNQNLTFYSGEPKEKSSKQNTHR